MDATTNLSEQQINAIFADATKSMAPAEPQAVPMKSRLAPFRKRLLDYRKRGYSSEQLATILRDPRIGIEVSASFLRRYLAPSSRHAKPAMATGLPPVARAATPATAR